MTGKPAILVLGQLPPPYMGPAIATEIILQSRLKDDWTLIHMDTNTHSSLETIGTITASRLISNFRLYIRMILLLLRHKPDLTLIPISQTTMGFLKDSVFVIISRVFRTTTLLQLRGSNFRNWLASTSKIMQAYVSFSLKRTQGVIVLGNNLRYLFSNFFPPDKIFVVPNGADFPVLPSSKKEMEKTRLLYLANLQGSKGIEDVISAVQKLKGRSSVGSLELNVIGDWFSDGIKGKVLDTVRSQELPVIFHGIAVGDRKWKFLSEADIFIFPPREPEGHPWVIIEAMAAGLPIISTDQGAITESVIDGLNGFIVDPGRPDQIAEKIMLLMQNAELRMKMGQESRRLYEEKFTGEKMVERLTYAFHAVLAERCAE